MIEAVAVLSSCSVLLLVSSRLQAVYIAQYYSVIYTHLKGECNVCYYYPAFELAFHDILRRFP